MKIIIIILSLLLASCFYTPNLKVLENTKQQKEIEGEQAKLEKLIKEKKIQEETQRIIDNEKKSAKHPAPAPVTIANIELPSPPPTLLPPPTARPTKIIPNSQPTIADQLYKVSTVFAIPNHANISEDIRAQLLINPVKDLEELSSEITTKGVQTKRKINVSKIVIAKLDAPDFEISNITPAEQAISESESTEWLWNLRPKKSGNLQVNLSITAIVTVGDKSTTHHIKTYDQLINIEVKPSQLLSTWFLKYWQWLVSTLILPLVIWVWKTKIQSAKKSN